MADYAGQLKRMNWALTLAVLALMVTGVFFLYSACYQNDLQPSNSYYRKQIGWVLVGAACYLGFTLVDYRRLEAAAWWLYGVGVVLLVLVLCVGRLSHGARRWLTFFGVNLQPSEFVKLATIICLAAFLSRPGANLRRPGQVIACLLLVAVPALLVVVQPDLGTAAVFAPVALVVMFVAGVPARTLGTLILAGLCLLPLSWLGMDDYQKNRIVVFVNPDKDPLGAGWNKMQSEIAVGSGGLWGKGYLQGTQNILGFLPRSVAPTDFIFPVIAEETGFAGAAGLLAAYAVIVSACVRVALAARDKFGRLLCVGAAALVFCHVFVNIAMTIGLVPITGLPLPLVSYGGSFMVVTLVALALVQSVHVRRHGAWRGGP